MASASPWQLFNTSWTLHRLSPLHHKKDCNTLLDNQSALNTYAARLRDQLTGDVLAGLQATNSTLDDDALSKTGALKECTWQSITSPRAAASGRRATSTSFPGILVTLTYENIVYKAALLAEAKSSSRRGSARSGSSFLPLLLTKCPNALRQTIISFLSSNFDAYCAPLRLPSAFLCLGLETFVDELRNRAGSSSDETVEDVVKELQLTLSFSAAIAPALRSLNVGISRSSLAGFLESDENNSKRTLNQKLRCPLIPNLTSYLETHLAMQLDLDGSSPDQIAKQHVRLSKVTCAAFVLGSDGRMKLVVDSTQSEGQGEEERVAKDQAALHASETLLRAVIQKAVIHDQPTT
ncbi:CENP-A-nucleosome distal centromere subunit CENP-L [Penicillium angulare]|uniref:CENP-A-nucleosome distal centromere subunit CENP-L n=1 Tax=Penicillium angulare TaxID=116970 RepID=A0A9W9K4W3_9EURO|nr:CENP-A-nucleosome distal centromere subunit CENP-L [Penicillium angulare]